MSKEGHGEHQGCTGYSLGDCGSAALCSRRPLFRQTSTCPSVDRCARRGNDKGRPGHTHLIGRGFSGGVQDPADCVFDAPVAAGGIRSNPASQFCRRAQYARPVVNRILQVSTEPDTPHIQCSTSTHSSSTPRSTIWSLNTGSEASRIEENRASRLVKAIRPSRIASGEPRQ